MKDLRKEIKAAQNWYRWLWLSPLFTLPTLFYISNSSYKIDNILILKGILVSSLWHLILLIPASNLRSDFICWHGRQALLLAGLRTIVPLGFLLLYELIDNGNLIALCVLILILIWLFGNLWGQDQAKRGDCSLMRWVGRGEVLLQYQNALTESEIMPGKSPEEFEISEEIGALLDTIRFNTNREERGIALERLRQFYETVVTAFEDPRSFTGTRKSDKQAQALVKIIRYSKDKGDRKMALKLLVDRDLMGLI